MTWTPLLLVDAPDDAIVTEEEARELLAPYSSAPSQGAGR